MPYCSHCGTFVLDADRFCPRCGTSQQPGVAPAEPAATTPEPAPPPAAEVAPEAAPSPSPPSPPPPPAEEAPPPQATPPSRPAYPVEPNIAAMLCYIPGLGWIAAIIFLALDAFRYHRYVRFHAFQGLFLAVIWLLATKLFFPFETGRIMIFPFLGFRTLWKMAVLAAQIVGIIKTVQKQEYRLPVLAELAEKSMA